MEILFVSDYVCPFCLVGKTVLEEALKATGISAQIQYHPFQLTVPPKPRADTWNDPVRREHYKELYEPCRELGLDMKLPPYVIPRPYSRLAFEGLYFAREQGKGDAYNSLMYRAYFIEELDIGDVDVLCGLAERVGLDKAAFREALEQERYADALDEADRYAKQELHVTHVPTIFIDGQEAKLPGWDTEKFAQMLLGAAGTQEGSFGCGPDGC